METALSILFWAIFIGGVIGIALLAFVFTLWWLENKR